MNAILVFIVARELLALPVMVFRRGNGSDSHAHFFRRQRVQRQVVNTKQRLSLALCTPREDSFVRKEAEKISCGLKSSECSVRAPQV